MYRPHDKQNYSGKFKRDTSERLNSSPLYKKNRDEVPAPTETDKAYLSMSRGKVH